MIIIHINSTSHKSESSPCLWRKWSHFLSLNKLICCIWADPVQLEVEQLTVWHTKQLTFHIFFKDKRPLLRAWTDRWRQRASWITSAAHEISWHDSITCSVLPRARAPFLSPFPSVRWGNVRRQSSSARTDMPPSTNMLPSGGCCLRALSSLSHSGGGMLLLLRSAIPESPRCLSEGTGCGLWWVSAMDPPLA